MALQIEHISAYCYIYSVFLNINSIV